MATSGLVRWLITANVQQGSSLVVTVVIIVEESQYLCFLMDIHSFPNKVFKTSLVTLEFDLRTIKVTLKWPTASDWHQKCPHFLRGLRAWNDPKLLGLEPHRNPHGLRTAPFEEAFFSHYSVQLKDSFLTPNSLVIPSEITSDHREQALLPNHTIAIHVLQKPPLELSVSTSRLPQELLCIRSYVC